MSPGRVPCCERAEPGLTGTLDWTDDDTTPDQKRITRVLEAAPLGPEHRVLHVGVGNSELARRLSSRVGQIDGVTRAQAEKDMADALNLANYTVHLANKYSQAFRSVVPGRYDDIVDNNLASYACCLFHLYVMFDNYLACLSPGGRILTDQEGMDWTATGSDDWCLSFDDLGSLVEPLGLVVRPVTALVYELVRPG